jgi:uncharacterized protein (TIGR02594 family)
MPLYKTSILVLAFSSIVGGCALSQPVSDSVVTAQPYVGLQERQDRTEIKELTGIDPVRTEWCAAFVNAVLEVDGIPGSNSVSDYPLMARSFLSWGERVERADIKRGDVVVFPRGNSSWQGHVGFYVETQTDPATGKEWWVILGGNQTNSVRYDLYQPSRALGIRRWINTGEEQQNEKMVKE